MFTERYRPQVHFTPAKHWINDPNGLVYLDGAPYLKKGDDFVPVNGYRSD